MNELLLVALFLFFPLLLSGQNRASADRPDIVIPIENPSFEGVRRYSKVPKGWEDCGFENESPPDILPSRIFEVDMKAADGNDYLGMVVRDNNTWESIGQQLALPLRKKDTYVMRMTLARSERYISTSRSTNLTVNFDTPAKLRIFGGTASCDKRMLLAESPAVKHHAWKEYEFTLSPTSDCSYLILEVYYQKPHSQYNGHLLIDHLSFINLKEKKNLSPEGTTESLQFLEQFIRDYGYYLTIHDRKIINKSYLGEVFSYLQELKEYRLVIGLLSEEKKRKNRKMEKFLRDELEELSAATSKYHIQIVHKNSLEGSWLASNDCLALKLEKLPSSFD